MKTSPYETKFSQDSTTYTCFYKAPRYLLNVRWTEKVWLRLENVVPNSAFNRLCNLEPHT